MPVRPRRAAALATLVLLGLAGCKTAQTLGEKPWAFACPEPGTSLRYDDGRDLTFTGTEPGNAGTCLARVAMAGGPPRPVKLAWGMVEEGTSEGSGHAAGMAALFPAKTGSNVSYTASLSSSGSGIQYRYDTRWRLVGFETVTVPAGRFAAVVFERSVQGTGANAGQSYKVTYWVEGGSGVVLKRAVEVGRGGSTLLRPFEAVKFSLPPPPRPAPQPAESGPPRG